MALLSRKKPEPEPAPEPAALSAAERLNAVFVEQNEIHAKLTEHQAKRADLLHADGELDLDAIRAIQSEDAALKWRLEQLALRLPAIEQELARERREAFEAAWREHRPILASAEAELVEAIQVFQAALERANAAHVGARGFGERLREFVAPPPLAPLYNDWSLRQYLAVVERRREQAPEAPMVELLIEAPLNIPPAKRFVPRRVPVAEVEQISVSAEPRKVRILHGPVKTAAWNFGVARMHPGEEHHVPAKAAYALVASGIAEYADEPATVAA